MRLLCLSFIFIWLISSCAQRGAPVRQKPDRALRELQQAAQSNEGAVPLFRLLSQSTRWSALSAYSELRKMCALIRSFYPRDLQVRESQRCQLAVIAPSVETWMAALLRKQKLLSPLLSQESLSELNIVVDAPKGRAWVMIQKAKFLLCAEEGEWRYCGLDPLMEQLKINVNRDLITVQENVEVYKQRD
jgi:hypothetical protein